MSIVLEKNAITRGRIESMLKWFVLDQGLLQMDVCENKLSIQEAKKMLAIYTENTYKL
jgi:hypothetical protein